MTSDAARTNFRNTCIHQRDKQARASRSFIVWKDKQRTEARSEETQPRTEGEKEGEVKWERQRESENPREGEREKAAAQDREMHG